MPKALVSPSELASLIETEPVVVIDTRDPASYAEGHIPGAVNIHDIFTYLATSTPEGLSELTQKFADAFGAAGLSGKETAVLAEQSMNTGFGQSCRGYYLLSFLGYPKVAVLHGVANAQEVAFARATGTVPVLNSLHQLALWQAGGGGRCHVMVDTGMNRLGLSAGELGDPLLAGADIDLLLSHLASAEDDSPQNGRQLARFREAVAQVPSRRRSLANSAGIALGPDYHFDLTRPGLALYGGVPCDELAGQIRQVAHVETAVLQVRQLQPGDTVGYNATWTADRPTRSATVALGYADGILRSWGASGALHHDGTRLPIIGRVSMDMIVVDLGDAQLKEGDFCRLSYDLPQAAQTSGLTQYELLTVLGHRFARTS